MPKSVQSIREPQQDVVAVTDTAPQVTASPMPMAPHCPSFDEEPWKSHGDQYRPSHFTDKSFLDLTESYPPLLSQHPYVRLINEFLDSIPQECWIDEENDVD